MESKVEHGAKDEKYQYCNEQILIWNYTPFMRLLLYGWLPGASLFKCSVTNWHWFVVIIYFMAGTEDGSAK